MEGDVSPIRGDAEGETATASGWSEGSAGEGDVKSITAWTGGAGSVDLGGNPLDESLSLFRMAGLGGGGLL